MQIKGVSLLDRSEIVNKFNNGLKNIFDETFLSIHSLDSLVELSRNLPMLKKQYLKSNGYNYSEWLSTAVMAQSIPGEDFSRIMEDKPSKNGRLAIFDFTL